jgi:hypothetical protein
MRKEFAILMTVLLCLACNNKTRQTEPIIYDDKPIVEQAEHDTLSSTNSDYSPKIEVKPSTPVSPSPSSRSHKSSDYDNMRGFDPASEDDMEDNGMSRYMENNDEEGWD